MAEYTTNYNLKKPDANESYNIADHNANMDILDGGLAACLPASEYTANDILTKLKTVDGENSGLDADKLDGKESSAFADASHGHAIADVTGLQTALDGKAASSHNHTIAQVTGLQTALDGKAASSHSHSISNVSGLQSALDGKAASSHNHTIAQITNLQSTLDGKAASNHTHNYAPSSHNHTIAQVTGLQTALNGKEATLNTDQKRKITISTSNPSGGANGDIWIKV